MSMPAAFQRSSSAIWVPERSPREMKGAPLDLMAFKASATSLMPLMPAGSLFGPIRTKSLYITGYRFTPKPSATNFSSCALACTNSTSASPRRPVSSAWPVPCATTFTSMPVVALNSGRIWLNRPESCVDVVEATTIDLSCASAGAPASAMVAAMTNRLRTMDIVFFSFVSRDRWPSHPQLPGGEPARLLGFGLGKESFGWTVLAHAAAMHEHNVARPTLGLAEIVRRHPHLHATQREGASDILEQPRR